MLDNDLHLLEKATVRDCIRVFRSIIAPINESRTGFSALESLWKLAAGKQKKFKIKVSIGFIMEFIKLFRGVLGKSNIYLENIEVKKGIPEYMQKRGREAAAARTEILDEFGSTLRKYYKKYPSGLEEVISWHEENRRKFLQPKNMSSGSVLGPEFLLFYQCE